MRLQRFFKDLSWWSKVFTQAPLSGIPDFPTEVADAVQPVFPVLGSCKHLAKSIWNMSGAGSAVIPLTTPALPACLTAAYMEQALAVPSDEIWYAGRFNVWHDDAVTHWAAFVAVFPDGVSYVPITERMSVANGTTVSRDIPTVLPPRWKIAMVMNGPLIGGAVWTVNFSYLPVKVGETVDAPAII